ncbi:LacI family DNA-binding transcriptional regulator [Microbacterium oryzae]|uniref:LacI family transcriptional regulator n=1 Tax=Microbacterium oryzae TaxID=743009 RepID=A0A6I6DWR7_9MICO|nr:LacI family DNA-binding transcriptional regulator [Microbacterium oryzae]QGU26374.1 LacI family transcriptional regulator [Microbacterium oryzae]
MTSARKDPVKLRISDVARHAGVSAATVSRVMNGNPSVDPALAERVQAAAAELGYSASPLARSLALGKTQTVAVLVPDLGNPTFQATLRMFSRTAAGDGYHVLVADSAEVAGDEAALALQARRRTDGILLVAPRMPDDELAALLPQLSPVVLVNRPAGLGAPVVAADYAEGIRQLIAHLRELGHRRILYLAGVTGSASHARRLAAIADARHAHPELEILEAACGTGFADGAAAADEVTRSGATAVLAYNDLVAMGLLSALHERGVTVPADVSVVGFDDIPFAPYTTPPLTTVAVPAEEMGALAWTALRRLLDTQEEAAPVVLAPALALRGSTAAPPRR